MGVDRECHYAPDQAINNGLIESFELSEERTTQPENSQNYQPQNNVTTAEDSSSGNEEVDVKVDDHDNANYEVVDIDIGEQ